LVANVVGCQCRYIKKYEITKTIENNLA